MSEESRPVTNLATRTAYLLLGWLGVALGLALFGAFDTQNKLPFALLLAVVTPLLLFALDRPAFGGVLFDGIRKLPRHSLILWQTDRVMGAAFLVAFAKGTLPSGFALPAGIGDVAIGLAAPWVAANLAMQKPHSKVIARWWNYLGIFDLVLALSMGITHTRSPLGIFAQETSMRPIGEYPLSLIPTWAVPLALILHLQSLASLREAARAAPSPEYDHAAI